VTERDGFGGRGDHGYADAALAVLWPLVVAVSLIALALTECFTALPGAVVAFLAAHLLLSKG
jgi:polyferredoxin